VDHLRLAVHGNTDSSFTLNSKYKKNRRRFSARRRRKITAPLPAEFLTARPLASRN